MKVKMKAHISGTRDGLPWPKPGESIEVPDEEGETLIANGHAVHPHGDLGDDAATDDEPGRHEGDAEAGGLTPELRHPRLT